MDNVKKYKIMNFQPGKIHTGISEEDFNWRITWYGTTYREFLRKFIPCPDYGEELTDGSMIEHHRYLHGTELYIDWDQLPLSQTEHLQYIYEVIFPTVTQSCQ